MSSGGPYSALRLMIIRVYQDQLGIVSLYERPDTRLVEAELADGFAVNTHGGQPLIVKDGGRLEMSAQRALECGLLRLPLLL
jgi:hypothetical protein